MVKQEERKPQIDKFRDAARELGTNQSEEAFDKILKKIAKTPPKKEDKKKGEGESK